MAKQKKVSKVARVYKLSPRKAQAQRGKQDRNKKTSEPSSMDELLSLYGVPKFSFSVGDMIKGKIIRIEPQRVVIDIGGKSEGLVAEKAFKEAEEFVKTLKIGDEIEARVLVTETRDGNTILSLRHAREEASWKRIQEIEEKQTPILVEGKGVTSSGMTVDIEGMTGFIPASQLGKEVSENPQKLIGQRFEAVVIDFDRAVKKIILSEKEVSEKEELARSREAIKNIKEGAVYEGEVTTIFDFGVFVKIEWGSGKTKIPLEGLVHISELSWEKVSSPDDVVSQGDKVKVKIVAKRNGKLAFSIKQALEDPWEKVEKKYKKDKRVRADITRVTDFGVFVQLEPGIEGLIHITKIPPGKKLVKGDKVDVYVEDIDKENRKIALGLVLTEKPVGYK
ncbi:hypothetical protein A2865_02910 [Candidatus Woesebacteria bacterium RIFCSPHIGHO2_01_FULL_39_17]|uniref:30S ribosomal protein S1 n=3 Tax=Candidatus Woeseibacteriota TaxID=1752722 RepID=A0A0G0NB34_9BACT|nr:MAG: 30S ribosomal protein S1 [Candidatus Woesebacteria bacterium GW2011_GWB1_39_10b]KKR13374.1 MAG: 30S ribosomal protein S1 [Candidatus Woesebacteria bacterium GW2011_GWA1_39_21b]KKS89704.1 MAG: 30S ribosomal protein S1 [Parcubacteria group bacterium GW2011_GWC1_43_11b]OGM23693.1 MAG: hypothetical protein A2865_02910 [Candidatus Woesebacteria bacterium RIFCSPHIGHO2_01_FULL_39_17]OGM63874.1 MAG: hypothetical protein A3A52_03875 [Candidatus Woesebacteria bacterium RIFCSPLOWO2_01_FULL_39_14]